MRSEDTRNPSEQSIVNGVFAPPVRVYHLPAQMRGGVVEPVLDENSRPVIEEGMPLVAAKYSGLHALRHFYASWCINRRADGGPELPPKVQERLGHASIKLKLDTYGHLFPSTDDGAELAAAEQLIPGQ